MTRVAVAKVRQKVLRTAVDGGLIAQTPCRSVPLPKIERQEMRFLTPAEITTLAHAMAPHYRAMVVFDAYCGLRLGELAALRRGRVDLLRRRVRVVETAVEVRGQLTFNPPKTAAGNRTVPMPAMVAELLSEHMARFAAPGPDGFVFPGSDGGALRANAWRPRHWRPAIAAAGLQPLRPHDLRHTAVSLWIAAGATPKQITTWAGHTSVALVLDRYGHLLPGHEEAVLYALDALGGNRQSRLVTSSNCQCQRCQRFPRVFCGFFGGPGDGRGVAPPLTCGLPVWAMRVSIPRPLPCEGSALPLS